MTYNTQPFTVWLRPTFSALDMQRKKCLLIVQTWLICIRLTADLEADLQALLCLKHFSSIKKKHQKTPTKQKTINKKVLEAH